MNDVPRETGFHRYRARLRGVVAAGAMLVLLASGWILAEPRRLARRAYAAPHLHHRLPADLPLPVEFVLHVPVWVGPFTGEAQVLAMLALPTDALAVVVHRDGRRGLAGDLFQPPDYGRRSGRREGAWHELQLLVSQPLSRVELYMDGRLIVARPWHGEAGPLEAIWLGTAWLHGGGGYGAPLDLRFGGPKLGNRGLLPAAPPGAWLRLLRSL